MSEVNLSSLQDLLSFASKNFYRARECLSKDRDYMSICIRLLSKDYKITVVSNLNGELCSQYPAEIPVLEYAIPNSNTSNINESVESIYDKERLRILFDKARLARCRSRFVVPVILYEDKHICRSATISAGAEIYGRIGMDMFWGSGTAATESVEKPEMEESSFHVSSSTGALSGDGQMFDRVRGHDISLLKLFNVEMICDFMVEKKKVKFGMSVTSSEKVDKEKRYSCFHLLSLPYPGCEFFKVWADSSYQADEVVFDWNQGFVDAHLEIPRELLLQANECLSDINWFNYKNWSLNQITKNYLRLLLYWLTSYPSGMLIHCISGWDRTPLFISLLRLSLWADSAAHASLSAREILYLTLAYDWYLFGHNLPDRLKRGEEILLFCFVFLQQITGDEFSVRTPLTRSKHRRMHAASECIRSRSKLNAPTKYSDRNSYNPIHRINSSNSFIGVLLDETSSTTSGSSNSIASGASKTTDAAAVFHVNAAEDHCFKDNSVSCVSTDVGIDSVYSLDDPKRPLNPVATALDFNYSSQKLSVPTLDSLRRGPQEPVSNRRSHTYSAVRSTYTNEHTTNSGNGILIPCSSPISSDYAYTPRQKGSHHSVVSCGSWQVISNGADPSSALMCASGSVCLSPSPTSSSTNSDVLDSGSHEESERKTRLEEVSALFLRVYGQLRKVELDSLTLTYSSRAQNTSTPKQSRTNRRFDTSSKCGVNGSSASTSMTGFVNQFVQKIGLRNDEGFEYV